MREMGELFTCLLTERNVTAMQNATEITGLRLSHRLGQLITAGSYPLLCLFYGMGGLVAAMARIVGSPAPFGVAYLAAVPFRFTLPSALGATLGCLISCGVGEGYRYAAAGLLVTLLRWILRPQRWDSHRSWLSAAAASAGVLVVGILPAIYSDPLLYDTIMWVTQIVIAGAAASFLCRALELLDSGSRSESQDTALWVLFAIGIMGLCTIDVGGVSLGRAAGGIAVLFAARVGGIPASVMTGVICGFGCGFATGDFTLCVTLYSLGGLMAGVFGSFGRVGSAAAFTAAYGFIGMLAGSGGGFLEVALAAMGFLMIPQHWYRIFTAAVEHSPSSAVRTVMTRQLSATAAALRDLSKTTGEVAGKLGRMYTGDISGIYDRAGERNCKRCPNLNSCWQERYNDTVDSLSHGLRRLMQGQTLEPEEIGGQLANCPRKKELAEQLGWEYDRYLRRDEEQRRAARTRRLLADQIEGLALALDGMTGEMDNICNGGNLLEPRVEALLVEHRLEPRRVVCWKNKQGRLTIMVELPEYKESRSAPELLTAELGIIAQIPLTYPVITRQGKVSRMMFYERPRYMPEYGSCQLNCDSNPVCGDSFRILSSGGGEVTLLLSDGMGSGNSAAVDSAMTASLFSRLLDAGIGCPAALKLINGALLVKSGDESLATVDAARVDLYTGRVNIYKAGAAPTVLRKDGRGIEVDSTSLPAGILEGAEFQQSQITLGDGDLLIMLSDGAVPDGSDWIAKAAESFDGDDLDQFCRKIATGARLRRTDGRDDDITVLCCRLASAKP